MEERRRRPGRTSRQMGRPVPRRNHQVTPLIAIADDHT
jgi:hypothetical protein